MNRTSANTHKQWLVALPYIVGSIMAGVFLHGCGGSAANNAQGTQPLAGPTSRSATVSFEFEGAARNSPILKKQGSPTTLTFVVEGITSSGSQQQSTTTVPVVNGVATVNQPVQTGVVNVAVNIQGGSIGGQTHFTGATDIKPGPNSATVGALGTQSAKRHDTLATLLQNQTYVQKLLLLPWDYFRKMALNSTDSTQAINRFSLASVNFFDDIKVYPTGRPDRAFLNESFDSQSATSESLITQAVSSSSTGVDNRLCPPSFVNFWSGKLGFVTDQFSLSGDKCWVNEAYPTWNRHDGILLRPSDIPTGLLTYEIACFILDAQKGVSFGPKKRVGSSSAYDNNGVIEMNNGQVRVSGYAPVLSTFVVGQWYRMKADLNIANHTINVYMNGQRIGNQVPLSPSPAGYDFDYLTFGGVYFAQ